MNENVQALPLQEVSYPDIAGLPPLQGWALKYCSGIDSATTKPGDWLSKWSPNERGVEFAFVPAMKLCFKTESFANEVSGYMRQEMGIDTELVKIN